MQNLLSIYQRGSNFAKQLFRAQIQKGGKVLLWNQVKSRMEACYSELVLGAPLWPALYFFMNNVVHNSASRGWFWCKTKTRKEKENNTPEMKIHMPIKSKESIKIKWNVKLENKDTTGFFLATSRLHIFIEHTVILPGWTFKKWGLSNLAFQSF